MPSITQSIDVKVDTHITAIEARFLDIKDVLITENEAFFVQDARFNDDGGVTVVLEGHPTKVYGRHEPLLIVRTTVTPFIKK